MLWNSCTYEKENCVGDSLCILRPKTESDSNVMYDHCIGYALCSKYHEDEAQCNAPEPTHFDNVSHPSHYTEGRKYEPKDVIRDWGLNFNLGNTVKYVARAGRKIEYLEKEREEK